MPPFSFLVIDQPSQVYFPSAVSGANELDLIQKLYDESTELSEHRSLESIEKENSRKKALLNRKDDITSTIRIFEMLAEGLKNANNNYQIIVLEHADNNIWGKVEGTYDAANWSGDNTGLIPQEWINDSVLSS